MFLTLTATLALIAGAHQATPVCIPPPETLISTPVARDIDAMLSRAAVFGFSGQVLIAREGQVILHRAYGLAERAAGRPFDVGTPVGGASMTKQFTAAAILLLQQQGRLRVSDTVGDHISDAPADKRGLTIHQLLTHTAGLRPGDVIPDLDGSQDVLLEQIFATPLRGEPGDAVRYANAGYSLLATIIERASGRPYPEFMRDALFRPAGMHRTGIIGTDTTPGGAAHAYVGWRDNGTPSEWPRNWRAFGGGDIVTTAGDLYCWAMTARAGTVLSAASRALQKTAHVGPVDDAWGYGMLRMTTPGGRLTWEHGGDTELGNNGLFREYDDSTLVMITSNARATQTDWFRWPVQDRIEALLFGDAAAPIPGAQAPSLAARGRLAGTYALDAHSRLHLIDDGAYLWLVPEGQSAVDWLSEKPLGELGTRMAQRTSELMMRVQRREEQPWNAALGAEGAQHAADWEASWKRDLTDKYGALLHFTVRGAVRHRRGPIATVVMARFIGADVPVWFLWGADGDHRLLGSSEHAGDFPKLYVAAISGDEIVAYDLFTQQARRLRVTSESDGVPALTVADGTARYRKEPFTGWRR